MKGKYLHFAAGLMVGAALFGGGTALAAGILAEPSEQTFYLDDRQIQLEAYAIAGHNYVQLRDVGRAVGFNVTLRRGPQRRGHRPGRALQRGHLGGHAHGQPRRPRSSRTGAGPSAPHRSLARPSLGTTGRGRTFLNRQTPPSSPAT